MEQVRLQRFSKEHLINTKAAGKGWGEGEEEEVGKRREQKGRKEKEKVLLVDNLSQDLSKGFTQAAC